MYLRAYASIWDFVNHVAGTHIPSVPPQTYGFFMALAFLVGIYYARQELARRTALGIFDKQTAEVTTGKGIQWMDLILYGILGYILGLKVIGFFLDSSSFHTNPQQYFLSLAGSPIGGILGMILVGGLYALDQRKQAANGPRVVKVSRNVEDRIGDVLVIAMVGGVLGSKILDAFDNPASMQELLTNPLVSLTSGLSVLGGLWLVSILLMWYARKNNIKILPFVDSLSPAFFLAYAVGRLGCQFSGDGCWGIPSANLVQPSWLPDLLWGQTYPHNVNKDGLPITGCTEPYCMELSQPHLPTPLYEFIFVLILFSILWAIRRRITHIYGCMTGLFLIMNGIERFTIEFVRVNDKYTYLGLHYSQAQYMSIAMIVIGLILTSWSISQRSKSSNTI